MTYNSPQPAPQSVGIDGALFLPLRIIPVAKGDVLRMLSKGSPLLPEFSANFGELYFSEIRPHAVKAWKRHHRQTQHFAVPCGQIRLVLFDGRPASPTYGALAELILGRPDNYGLLRIPPEIWYGFAAMGTCPALICNCADIPHDPAESEKLPVDTPTIPFDWNSTDTQTAIVQNFRTGHAH
ncbi:MAG: dTDP-4-dehydrorhamnose 3,5-epimerase [Candidatus Desulfovibrio kirbyi]|jgi:dTDP-4-dehydrorhamnose 3,5-epimerase|uniref:dTDP-4-dehydrorhamnose 3,5-epimerase n=1 Tax=Candidatus Desulfovibrio kirbyi TaxID=2696086 RepID=A0A6L2R5Y9_9BACT|nr:dTDP-4-dehydrorhamnose 3,5-epimerase family protein [Desulfovibrio sp.]GFH62957.1 MAG: dTDP-4-dehydrorhamnose 3,5-epimerase [Candidatus Desulfovibrio kirbyi]